MNDTSIRKPLILTAISFIIFGILLLINELEFRNILPFLDILVPVMIVFVVWLMKNIIFGIYRQSPTKPKGFKICFWMFVLAALILGSGFFFRISFPKISNIIIIIGLLSTALTCIIFSRLLLKVI